MLTSLIADLRRLGNTARWSWQGWTSAWRFPEPKPHYDIIIVGGGGHGLATAH